MMMSSFAQAGRLLGEPRYTGAARKNAEFILGKLRVPDTGRLWRNHKDGRSTLNAYLEDYALVIEGLVELYQVTYDEAWITHAAQFARIVQEQFADKDKGGYFFTSQDHEQLIQRPKEFDDNATPCGNSVMAFALQKLALLAGNPHFGFSADQSLRLVRDLVGRSPLFFGYWLCAAEFHASKPREIVLAGDRAQIAPFEQILRGQFAPFCVVAAAPGKLPLLEGKEPVGGQGTAFVCESFACQEPVTSEEKFAAAVKNV